MLKPFCDRCDAAADIVSRVFDVDEALNLEIIIRSHDKSAQPHICENCLAELLMASVETFKNSKVVTSYHTAFRTATELETIREEIEQLKSEKADLIKRMVKADDDVLDLQKRLTRANEQVELLGKEASRAKKDADDHIKKTLAEWRQRAEDEKNEPEYVAAVERRERLRSSR